MSHNKNAISAPMPNKVVLTVKEALPVFNIGSTQFYKEVRLGRIKVVKMGRRTLVPATEPAEWLKRLEDAAA